MSKEEQEKYFLILTILISIAVNAQPGKRRIRVVNDQQVVNAGNADVTVPKIIVQQKAIQWGT